MPETDVKSDLAFCLGSLNEKTISDVREHVKLDPKYVPKVALHYVWGHLLR